MLTIIVIIVNRYSLKFGCCSFMPKLYYQNTKHNSDAASIIPTYSVDNGHEYTGSCNINTVPLKLVLMNLLLAIMTERVILDDDNQVMVDCRPLIDTSIVCAHIVHTHTFTHTHTHTHTHSHTHTH